MRRRPTLAWIAELIMYGRNVRETESSWKSVRAVKPSAAVIR